MLVNNIKFLCNNFICTVPWNRSLAVLKEWLLIKNWHFVKGMVSVYHFSKLNLTRNFNLAQFFNVSLSLTCDVFFFFCRKYLSFLVRGVVPLIAFSAFFFETELTLIKWFLWRTSTFFIPFDIIWDDSYAGLIFFIICGTDGLKFAYLVTKSRIWESNLDGLC